MMDSTLRRRFFAEEIEAVANLRSRELVEALATVPREQFLRPGPWLVLGEGSLASGGAPRQTADADPRHVYHNVAVAIEPARQLFNGGPATLAMTLDALAPRAGERVLHVGCGLGYYTALMAHCVGPTGRVVAVEVEPALAAEARRNLAAMPWVEARQGDGTEPIDEMFDAVLVNAGVTHPREAWLDALSPAGRVVLPITVTAPQMGTIGKGPMLRLGRTGETAFDVRVITLVAIYSAVGLRDDALNEAIGKALMRGPMPPLKRLRRDAHEPSAACWLHGPAFCLSTA